MRPIPLPFAPAAWPHALRPAADALWRFHQALREPLAHGDTEGFFREESARASEAQHLRVIPSAVAARAYEACREHGIPLTLLGEQVRASARFARPIRFETAADLHDFVQRWAGSHALLLARLAAQTGSWRERPISEFAKALFLTSRLCAMREDLKRDRVFIPLNDLRIPLDQLRAGAVDEAVQRLLWKQTVRIRDAYGACQMLGRDLSGWPRRAFKKTWLGGLYLVTTVERRGYDVWSKPFALSGIARRQIQLQALFGKTSFR